MTNWVNSYNGFIVFVLTALVDMTIGQDTLYGLPPIPGEGKRFIRVEIRFKFGCR